MKDFFAENKREILLSLIIFAVILLGVQVRIFMLLAFICMVASIIFVDNKQGFFIIMAFLPFATIFRMGEESMSFYTFAQIIYVVKAFIKNHKINLTEIILIAITGIYLGVMSIVNLNKNISAADTIRIVLFMFLIRQYVAEEYSEKQFISLSLIMLFSVALSSFVGLLRDSWQPLGELATPVYHGGDLGEGHISFRLAGLLRDPNFFVVLILVPTSICLFMLALSKISLVYLVPVCINIVFGILTFSKSFYIIFLLVMLVFLVLLVIKKKYYVALFFVSFSCVVLALLNLHMDLMEILLRRFMGTEGGLSSLTTGRTDIWLSYIEHFINEPLKFVFGFGVGAPYIDGCASHNTVIQAVYNFGLVGTALFVTTIVYIFRKVKGGNFINYIPMFVLFLLQLFLDSLFLYDFPFQWIMTVGFINVRMGSIKKDKKVTGKYSK